MSEAILVLNAGSSSLKFAAYIAGPGDALELEVAGNLEELYGAARFRARTPDGAVAGEHAWPKGAPPRHEGALEFLFAWLRDFDKDAELKAIGHRVVHGGVEYSAPTLIDSEVLSALERFVPLAPLHQPHNLLPIKVLREQRPELPQVACFDTAFHRSSPTLAQAYALPKWLSDKGVRRYGFHGMSYQYIASVLPQFDPKAAAGKTIVMHLGNGSSMCAIENGRSVASTMGFTAVEGLPMGTRCGSVDPGVLLFLMQQMGMDARQIETLVYKESGLLGVSGISSDMRVLLDSEAPEARFAVELFCYRIGRELGSLAAALGGLDAIVFTAGIGQNASPIRAEVCRHAAWLGVGLDEAANAAGGPRISTPGSRVAAWVIPTDEEKMIARKTLDVVGHN
jgi:acetate kinase